MMRSSDLARRLLIYNSRRFLWILQSFYGDFVIRSDLEEIQKRSRSNG